MLIVKRNLKLDRWDFILIGVGVFILILLFTYSQFTGGTINSTELCSQEQYMNLKSVAPPGACSTVWVHYCTESGFWAEQCINGVVDFEIIHDEYNELRDDLLEIDPDIEYITG